MLSMYHHNQYEETESQRVNIMCSVWKVLFSFSTDQLRAMIPLSLHIHPPHFPASLPWCFFPSTISPPSPLSCLLIHFLLPNTLSSLFHTPFIHSTASLLQKYLFLGISAGDCTKGMCLGHQDSCFWDIEQQYAVKMCRDLSSGWATTLSQQDALALFELRLRALEKPWTRRIHSKEKLSKGDIGGRDRALEREVVKPRKLLLDDLLLGFIMDF